MFEKTATTIDQQIRLLQSRGLEVKETDNLEHLLSHISYYRPGEYWYSMHLE